VTEAARPAATGRSGGGVPRVVLVDDHGLFRSGVRAELGRAVEVVGEADDVAPAIEVIASARPDVVLLDVHLPGGGGAAVVTAIRERLPDVRFLALSASDAPEDVIAVIRAGARGYVTKTISTAELADAIRRVASGDAVFSHRLAGFVLDAFASAPAGADAVKPSFDPELDQLTARERDVLRLIAQGYTYKEIARELYISVKTVESHVSSVLRKLQLSSRHQLTRWAAERRLALPPGGYPPIPLSQIDGVSSWLMMPGSMTRLIRRGPMWRGSMTTCLAGRITTPLTGLSATRSSHRSPR
jgi:DNA-binding NarL/FixJ family response regulator